MIRLKVFGQLSTLLGTKELEIDKTESTIADLLGIVKQNAGSEDTQGLSVSNLLITVNKVEISALDGESTVIR